MQQLHTATTACGSPNRCAGSLLTVMPEVMWFVRRQMGRQRSKTLSVPQFRTLAMLKRFRAATLSAVAENLGASLPTASRMISGLVAKGFVTRKDSSDDRREVKIHITARGRAALEAALEATQAAMAQQLAGL